MYFVERPFGLREARVAAPERLGDRHDVEHREVADRLRVVEREAVRGVAAAVVADDGEALVPSSRMSAIPSRATARLDCVE